jgi:hypothetical protein
MSSSTQVCWIEDEDWKVLMAKTRCTSKRAGRHHCFFDLRAAGMADYIPSRAERRYKRTLNWLFEEIFSLLCAPRELADVYF